jgi:hypothetical protein
MISHSSSVRFLAFFGLVLVSTSLAVRFGPASCKVDGPATADDGVAVAFNPSVCCTEFGVTWIHCDAFVEPADGGFSLNADFDIFSGLLCFASL